MGMGGVTVQAIRRLIRPFVSFSPDFMVHILVLPGNLTPRQAS